ncbi:MAG: GNAT family N-acetyltransferase [Patescibacteria group bacterium]
MKISIKKYRKTDFDELNDCLCQLQDFLVKIDPLARLRRAPDYSPEYTKNLIDKTEKQNGVIFLAYGGGKVVGFIAGIIDEQSKKNLLECVPTKAGRIVELYVSEAYRSAGIGQQLMEKMEDYMKKKKCDVLRVEVFEPNKTAHQFYCKLRYQNRMIDMIKPLK